jgi:hypothetical protein
MFGVVRISKPSPSQNPVNLDQHVERILAQVLDQLTTEHDIDRAIIEWQPARARHQHCCIRKWISSPVTAWRSDIDFSAGPPSHQLVTSISP